MAADSEAHVRHGGFSMGGGLVAAVAFFLPAVRGCGDELSVADLASKDSVYYLYAVAAAAAVMGGYALVQSRARWGLIVQGTIGSLALVHLLSKAVKVANNDMADVEPLFGFWVLLGSLGFVAAQPWVSLKALGPEPRAEGAGRDPRVLSGWPPADRPVDDAAPAGASPAGDAWAGVQWYERDGLAYRRDGDDLLGMIVRRSAEAVIAERDGHQVRLDRLARRDPSGSG
ncbi:hypothetical protein L6R50_07935 [Myxococcota bacterium]|nr:hypothetical protein [Myxococcota bacterium]